MSLNTSSCIDIDVFIGSHAALLEISDKLFFIKLSTITFPLAEEHFL